MPTDGYVGNALSHNHLGQHWEQRWAHPQATVGPPCEGAGSLHQGQRWRPAPGSHDGSQPQPPGPANHSHPWVSLQVYTRIVRPPVQHVPTIFTHADKNMCTYYTYMYMHIYMACTRLFLYLELVCRVISPYTRSAHLTLDA